MIEKYKYFAKIKGSLRLGTYSVMLFSALKPVFSLATIIISAKQIINERIVVYSSCVKRCL